MTLIIVIVVIYKRVLKQKESNIDRESLSNESSWAMRKQLTMRYRELATFANYLWSSEFQHPPSTRCSSVSSILIVQKMGPPLEISFLPRTNDLQRLMGLSLRVLQTVHSSLSVTFLVVFAFFLKMGFVWPPKPFCLAAYLLSPCLRVITLPFLYCETLWTVCFLHFLQWVLSCLGTCT